MSDVVGDAVSGFHAGDENGNSVGDKDGAMRVETVGEAVMGDVLLSACVGVGPTDCLLLLLDGYEGYAGYEGQAGHPGGGDTVVGLKVGDVVGDNVGEVVGEYVGDSDESVIV